MRRILAYIPIFLLVAGCANGVQPRTAEEQLYALARGEAVAVLKTASGYINLPDCDEAVSLNCADPDVREKVLSARDHLKSVLKSSIAIARQSANPNGPKTTNAYLLAAEALDGLAGALAEGGNQNEQ